jgi:hypothetical protein
MLSLGATMLLWLKPSLARGVSSLLAEFMVDVAVAETQPCV